MVVGGERLDHRQVARVDADAHRLVDREGFERPLDQRGDDGDVRFHLAIHQVPGDRGREGDDVLLDRTLPPFLGGPDVVDRVGRGAQGRGQARLFGHLSFQTPGLIPGLPRLLDREFLGRRPGIDGGFRGSFLSEGAEVVERPRAGRGFPSRRVTRQGRRRWRPARFLRPPRAYGSAQRFPSAPLRHPACGPVRAFPSRRPTPGTRAATSGR